jgi:DNA/RNA-binding domain of Phe-tRNA-synthetase-like protein
MAINITITPELKSCCPEMALGVICCDIKNDVENKELWALMETEMQKLKSVYTLETIKNQPEIAATRQVYKQTGKDPTRYRPSAEALCRRVLKDWELYRISNAVDVINLISIRTGFSIGGFDFDHINGKITAGIGVADEHFEAIGRGVLNIEGLPVLRDELGAIGTPTSDTPRTSIQLHTKRLLMNINAYRGKNSLVPVMDDVVALLKTYLCAENIESKIVK